MGTVAAVLLLPPLAAAAVAAWSVVQVFAAKWFLLWPLAAGAAAYSIIHVFFYRPIGIYVFGHELTHAIAAALSGYRVKSLRASPGGGEVILSDTNIWVALAPYCFPLYTLAVVLMLQIVRHYSGLGSAPPIWVGAVGFTYAFHIALTIYALTQRQPDLKLAGAFLSVVLVLLVNLLVALLLLKSLFPAAVSLKAFGVEFGRNLLAVFTWGGHTIMKGFSGAFDMASGLRA